MRRSPLIALLPAASFLAACSGAPSPIAAKPPSVGEADYQGKSNPYKDLAERRREDWKRVAEAEARHREQVAKVCAQYKDDSAKLAKLLALDDDVVSAKQKAGYKSELAQVYAPYQGAIQECEAGLRAEAQAASSRASAAREAEYRRTGMTPLPGGTLKMGDRGDTVRVAPFAIDLTEATVDAYEACVKSGKCLEPNKGGHCNWGVSGKGNHPVNCVDWNQATAYCGVAGKRLPTEEEWEWAARGQEKGTEYPWGNDEPAGKLCWTRGQGTCAVGGYAQGDAPGAVHDLAGNVLEWTSSAYDGSTRALRGGAWLHVEPLLRQPRLSRRRPGLPLRPVISLYPLLSIPLSDPPIPRAKRALAPVRSRPASEASGRVGMTSHS